MRKFLNVLLLVASVSLFAFCIGKMEIAENLADRSSAAMWSLRALIIGIIALGQGARMYVQMESRKPANS